MSKPSSKANWQFTKTKMTKYQEAQMAIMQLRWFLDKLKVIPVHNTFENWPTFINKYQV